MELFDFIEVSEVEEGSDAAEAMFQRAYKKSAPEFPHHIIAFYGRADGSRIPVSYVHFTDCADIYLAGGACTDGAALRTMTMEQQSALRDYGGLMLATLRHGFEKYATSCDAIFTCCGDARALETTPKLGFVETGIPYLLVNFSRELPASRKRQLIAKAASFMPF